MELHFLEQKKKESLKQKSRVKWAIEGDENTKFFHSLVNKNTRSQIINGLNINGRWNEDPEVISNYVRDHFAYRFKETNPSRPKFRSNHFRKLDHQDVDLLEAPFFMDEVKQAVWS